MIATGVNKTRRRGPLFFFTCFFFFLNKTENETKTKTNQQTKRQWNPTSMEAFYRQFTQKGLGDVNKSFFDSGRQGNDSF